MGWRDGCSVAGDRDNADGGIVVDGAASRDGAGIGVQVPRDGGGMTLTNGRGEGRLQVAVSAISAGVTIPAGATIPVGVTIPVRNIVANAAVVALLARRRR
jgi:hypothetical protein